MADVRHVDTDLMGPSGFQFAADVGIAPVSGHHLPVGHGVLGVALCNAHLLPVTGVPSDGGIHSAAVLPEGAADDGFICSGHGVVLQLACQEGMGIVVLCHRQQTGGVLVNAVDDAGA